MGLARDSDNKFNLMTFAQHSHEGNSMKDGGINTAGSERVDAEASSISILNTGSPIKS